MKKAILSIFLIVICFISKAQYPLQQNLGSSSTLVQVPANGALRAGLITISFTDTVAANLTNIKYYDGAIIKTTDPIIALWYRHLATTQWIQILPSGGSGGQRSWLIGGQGGIFTSPVDPQYIGVTTAQGFGILTNNVARVTISSAGAWGLGAGLDYGTSGYVLTSQGNAAAPVWAAASAGSVPISSLIDATGVNDLEVGNYLQQWNFTELETQGLLLASTGESAATGHSPFTSTTAGANVNSGITSYGARFSNTHTGTGSVNIGAEFVASGGGSNYAIKLTDGSQGSGKILQSDATGRATWVAPSSLYPTWQQTLTAGSTLTGTNTIAGGGNDFTWSNFGTFDIDQQLYLSTTVSQMSSPDDSRGFRAYNDSLNLIGSASSPTSTRDLMMVVDTLTGKIGHREIPSGGSGANTALSNLASVAINTSLISDANNTDDLGSASIGWKDIYGYSLKLNGSSSGTATIVAPAAAGTPTLTLPTTTGTFALTSDIPASPSIYGEYITTTFPGASLPTGFAKLDGAATITFNNPSISITGGDGNFNNNYVRNTDTSASNNYDYIWEFTLNTKFTAHAGQGKWFGKKTVNGVTQWNAYVNFKYGGSSSLARATLSLVSGTGNGTTVDSTGTISMADGNVYRIKFSQRMNLINVKVSRLVAGEEAESVYMNYRQNMAATNVLPNVGLAAFGSLDATSGITVTSFKINYDDILNTDAVVIGTSISQGYMVSSMNNHYIEKAFRGSNKTFVNMGQSGSGWANALAVLPRAERLNPEYYIIEMGANDQAMSVVDFRGWLQVFYDSIVTSYGKQMILLKSYANPTYDSIFYNFSSQYGLILIDPASVMTASAFRADLIHPNDYGNDIMASFCKAAIPSLFGSQVVNDRYSLQGLGDVVIGNSPANNDALLYSSATGKWANSSLTTSFIQNQAASAQTGNFWITGYGAVNSTFGIGANAIAGAKLLVYENTVSGTGVRLQNDASNASISGLKYSQIIQMGTTGFGVSGWPNALLIENQANGGIVNSSIGATYLWQTGTARTLRMTLNATGLGIAQATPTARLHLAASTTAASSGQIKLAEGSALTTPEDGNINYVANNLNFTEGSTVYTLAKTLTNTATLDFGNTAAGVAADLTITVTGAAVGDAVYVGADNASVSADNITFWGWVSATNTVTVRFNNNNLVSAVDPASGTFRVVVTKY